jgi:hypothetical protein
VGAWEEENGEMKTTGYSWEISYWRLQKSMEKILNTTEIYMDPEDLKAQLNECRAILDAIIDNLRERISQGLEPPESEDAFCRQLKDDMRKLHEISAAWPTGPRHLRSVQA